MKGIFLTTMWLIVSLSAAVLLAFFLFKLYRASWAATMVDWNHPHVNFVDGTIRLFCHRYHRLSADTIVPLPESGPAIVVGNHISGLDPLILVAITRRPLRFLIAREEYERFGFRWLYRAAGCIPVDREKKPERALRAAFDALAQGDAVALFPEGGIHWPPGKNKVKGGAIRMAIKYNVPIYTAQISGVKFPGFTLLALPFRSRLKVKLIEPFHCSEDQSYHDCVNRLTQLIKEVKHGK